MFAEFVFESGEHIVERTVVAAFVVPAVVSAAVFPVAVRAVSGRAVILSVMRTFAEVLAFLGLRTGRGSHCLFHGQI